MLWVRQPTFHVTFGGKAFGGKAEVGEGQLPLLQHRTAPGVLVTEGIRKQSGLRPASITESLLVWLAADHVNQFNQEHYTDLVENARYSVTLSTDYCRSTLKLIGTSPLSPAAVARFCYKTEPDDTARTFRAVVVAKLIRIKRLELSQYHRPS